MSGRGDHEDEEDCYDQKEVHSGQLRCRAPDPNNCRWCGRHFWAALRRCLQRCLRVHNFTPVQDPGRAWIKRKFVSIVSTMASYGDDEAVRRLGRVHANPQRRARLPAVPREPHAAFPFELESTNLGLLLADGR